MTKPPKKLIVCHCLIPRKVNYPYMGYSYFNKFNYFIKNLQLGNT